MRISLWLILILAGCSRAQMDDCITSAGERSEQWREVESFHTIRCTDRIKVYLFQDTDESAVVKVEGPRNLLGQIETEVVDGELRIDNEMTCNFVRKIDQDLRVYVNALGLKELIIDAAAEVYTMDTLSLGELSIYHEGQSDIDLVLDCEEVFVRSYNGSHTRLSGKSDRLKGSIEDVSDLDARDLVAREVLLDVHTPLDCYIDGAELIFVRIYNSGNIYYRRDPSMRKELNVRLGAGDLLPLP